MSTVGRDSVKLERSTHRALVSIKGDFERHSGKEISISEAVMWLIAWLQFTGGTRELGTAIGEVDQMVERTGYLLGEIEGGSEQEMAAWKEKLNTYVKGLELANANPTPKRK